MIRIAIIALCACLAPVSSWAAPLSDAALEEKLETVRKEAGLVALGAIVANADGDVLGLAVTGTRRAGKPDAARPGDAWHIGSNTKMLTALLYGRLVEQGHAAWGATLPELLPDLAGEMDPAWQAVTIEDLLSHRSGLPANPGLVWFLTSRSSEDPVETQRTRLARTFLSKPPETDPGSFTYSNLGYMIAGAAIDRIAQATGQENYEALFLDSLGPAEEGWGFGPPPEGIQGHGKGLFGKLKAQGTGPGADNPPALAPAGTLHVPLAAHAGLLSSFLTPDETEAKLLSPYPGAASDYALGWGVIPDGASGPAFGHSGSNTMWLSTVRLYPEAEIVVIVNTNSFSETGVQALGRLAADLAADYGALPQD